MLVRLVTPHLSAATTLGSTPPPSESRPEWLEEARGVTEPQSQGQECSPDLSKQTPTFPPLPLKKPNVHLILLQFHLSTHKPPRPPQSTPPPRSSLHFQVSPHLFFPSADLSHSHSLHPPQLLSRGVYFMPRWLDRLRVISQGGGLNFGQEPAVWSDVSAGSRICASACVGVDESEAPSRKGQLCKGCSKMREVLN